GPEKHNSHLSCGKCIITRKDVALQLGLPVDELVITESVIVPSKVGLRKSLLRKVPDKFNGGRISMNWLKDNFNELPENLKDQTDDVIAQYA
ncbi:hypothetical protein Goari_020596, partial [Gossypium aridum]|nr:hypothetical protein [Gossypium aridum]